MAKLASVPELLWSTDPPSSPSWVRSFQGSLLNLGRIDRILVRGGGESADVMAETGSASVSLFRGSWIQCAEVVDRLSDELAAVVPSLAADSDDDAPGFMAEVPL